MEQKGIRNRFTMSTYLSQETFLVDDWVSQAEAARIRGVSRQAIARLIKRGRFRTLSVGGKVLLRRSEVKNYMPEQPGRRPKGYQFDIKYIVLENRRRGISMRPPAEIALWLSTEDMQTWVREAPDKASYQRRLAIWLTHVERLAAHRVAQSLCVSTPAVWRWVQQHNHQGPEGLHRAGRGGRRWAFLKWEQEQRLLEKALDAGARRRALHAN